MTAEEGFKSAMMAQMNASLKGDRKGEERARLVVLRFRRLMGKRPN
jgi:hypothetical protein